MKKISLIAGGVVVALTAIMFSGCTAAKAGGNAVDSSLTAQGLASDAILNAESLQSVTVNESRDCRLTANHGDNYLTISHTPTSVTDLDLKTANYYSKVNKVNNSKSKKNGTETEINTENKTVEQYTIPNSKGGADIYTKETSDPTSLWTKSTQDTSLTAEEELSTVVATFYNGVSDGSISAQLDSTTVDVNGLEAYKITTEISGDAMATIAARSGLIMYTKNSTNDCKANMVLYIYKENRCPAKVVIDAKDLAVKDTKVIISDVSDNEINVEAWNYEITFGNINGVSVQLPGDEKKEAEKSAIEEYSTTTSSEAAG